MYKNNLSNKLKGDSGEYYIASELARRGINPAILTTNSKGADILATTDGQKVISIQVKTSAGNILPRRWDVGNHKPKPSNIFFYIFLNLWENFEKKLQYFIVPSKLVRDTVNWSKTRPQFILKNDEEYNKFLYNWQQIINILK